jgi:hypothetical protein
MGVSKRGESRLSPFCAAYKYLRGSRVFGGTKFIGPYVVKALHEKGHEVMLFNRGKTIYPFPFQINSIQGDRADILSLKFFNSRLRDGIQSMINFQIL